mmetsp:Transcript_56732/g.67958  ORF Transcript_56732/g.67958 Transcript_56732/m.67958 type:complete len:94 (-) Transcript_56732:548-829(-)|eukprot:CAMPEP_0172487952 /NCGR_PEP_ID=MMETSP1066-20121228/17270_1 /TAXON_ID=671091 /ORGANISM="Coscinodiscus wailesii, Strain CCMP2513" /LENGTH=93 /DNA_ID=CAMNT_0013254883 /DNA_START=26 /DNA_END=307 /DNA_ORIENTATION=-
MASDAYELRIALYSSNDESLYEEKCEYSSDEESPAKQTVITRKPNPIAGKPPIIAKPPHTIIAPKQTTITCKTNYIAAKHPHNLHDDPQCKNT